jgi:hypothetical protein
VHFLITLKGKKSIYCVLFCTNCFFKFLYFTAALKKISMQPRQSSGPMKMDGSS